MPGSWRAGTKKLSRAEETIDDVDARRGTRSASLIWDMVKGVRSCAYIFACVFGCRYPRSWSLIILLLFLDRLGWSVGWCLFGVHPIRSGLYFTRPVGIQVSGGWAQATKCIFFRPVCGYAMHASVVCMYLCNVSMYVCALSGFSYQDVVYDCLQMNRIFSAGHSS